MWNPLRKGFAQELWFQWCLLVVHYGTRLEDNVAEVPKELGRLSRLTTQGYEDLQQYHQRGSHVGRVCQESQQIERIAMDGHSSHHC